MKNLSSFSVILVFVVLMVIGAGMTPLLNIQYSPTQKKSVLSISYSWSGASAKLIEMEVTSKIEGLVASVAGVENISSVSTKESGYVNVQFKKGTNMETVRFEIATLIRQIYKKLPDGVSYPYISASSTGSQMQPILTFTINADIPTQEIETYTEENIINELSLLEGVNSVYLSGATPYYKEVSFDPQKLAAYGISIGELEAAIGNTMGQYDVVGSIDGTGLLLTHNADTENLEAIPIKSAGGRIIRVGDVATVSFKEKQPTRYYRINGLNTINITVYPEKFVNTLDVCAAVKEKMEELSQHFPENFSVITASDSSVTLKKELDKIVVRTVLSLIILLLFVLAASRSFKYLFIISFALAANIFIAFIFYVLFDMEIHLYSLAGITVSLGIIIDTAIVMVAHYGYYKNRKVFIAILAAQLTTMGALVVVFLLPEEQRANLIDFSGVIIINLAISLLTSLLLIPALVDSMQVSERKSISTFKNKRAVIKFNLFYGKYIAFVCKYKWATILVLVLGFGLPLDQLPDKLEYPAASAKPTHIDSVWVDVYNSTLGSNFFVNKAKEKLVAVFGGSLNLFLMNLSGGFHRDPVRPTLNINASLPDGCTIAQLNEVVLSMENYLSQFEEIEMFYTNISSYKNASIIVNFKPEVEYGMFPVMLRNEVIAKAQDFGGANWSVYGIVEQGFSNHVYSGYKSEQIRFTGYNYDQLYAYCQECVASLSKNGRVKEPEIMGRVSWGSNLSRSEYFIEYDHSKLASYELSLNDAYTALKEQLYMQPVGVYYKDGVKSSVEMVSGNKGVFDVWNLKNEYISVGERQLRFSDIGEIAKRNSGNDIYKDNQQYSLYVAYDYIGTSQQAKRLMEREIKRLNESVLPVGYKADSLSYSWGYGSGNNYIWLLLIIIAVIYFVCAVLFESLKYPLIIIGLIPVSFIGVFLTFAITGFRFDQGGFASLVMLAGIVVNAGIYILNEYRIQMRTKHYNGVKLYVRAYNHKIIPILLTVLSTVLGLIPFLLEGEKDVFWFAFALGTMGGLLFSLVALVLLMPAWVRR